jgi:tripartite-type tricarboxylate transporter receptor subunit TctC
MRVTRRNVLHLGAGTFAASTLPRTARALSYPTRPVHIVIGYPAGGTSDTVGRLMAQWLSDRLGQTFVIDNRPGAGSNIATEMVTRAPPDGYTLLQITASNAINATLFDNLNFNFIRDIVPVGGIFRAPNILEINPSVPATTVPELIAYVKANPGKLNLASSGVGSVQHLAGELFKSMAGLDMRDVAYRGSPAVLVDLLRGDVQAFFDLVPASIQFIKAGKLRPLAVTGTTRVAALPDLPTISDFLPGYEASTWNGFGAPANTPTEIVDILNKEMNAALADAGFQARLADLGATPMPVTPAEFSTLIASETKKWGALIKSAGIQAE